MVMAVPVKNPPIAPSHVFFGLILGASARRPHVLPARYAPLSVAQVPSKAIVVHARPRGNARSITMCIAIQPI